MLRRLDCYFLGIFLLISFLYFLNYFFILHTSYFKTFYNTILHFFFKNILKNAVQTISNVKGLLEIIRKEMDDCWHAQAKMHSFRLFIGRNGKFTRLSSGVVWFGLGS